MSDYWDHPEYGALEKKLEKQVATTRKWMALHDEAVEREATLCSEVSRLKEVIRYSRTSNGCGDGCSGCWECWDVGDSGPPETVSGRQK